MSTLITTDSSNPLEVPSRRRVTPALADLTTTRLISRPLSPIIPACAIETLQVLLYSFTKLYHYSYSVIGLIKIFAGKVL